jgi:hypothetical protein
MMRIHDQRIHDDIASNPTVYLVSHDPDTGIRLAARRVIEPIALEVAA